MLVKWFHKYSIFCLFLIYSFLSNAQGNIVYDETSDSDVQFRIAAEITKRLNRNWSLSWEEEIRLRENISEFDRLYTTLGIRYRISPYFSLSLAGQHRLINHPGKPSTDYQGYWDHRYRGMFTASVIYPIGQYELSFRQRINATLRTDSVNTAEANNPKLMSRSRLQLEYSFWSLPIKPYVSIEMFNPLNNVSYISDEWVETMRYTVGTAYRIDARSRLEFYYFFEHDFGKDVNIKKNSGIVEITKETEFNHVFGIAYQYRF